MRDLSGVGIVLAEGGKHGQESAGGLVPVTEAGKPLLEMGRKLVVAVGRDLPEEMPAIHQTGHQRLLEEADGETPEGQFGPVVGAAAVGDEDDFDRPHALEQPEPGGGTALGKTGTFNDFGETQGPLSGEERVIDERCGARQAERVGNPAEVAGHGLDRLIGGGNGVGQRRGRGHAGGDTSANARVQHFLN